MTDDRGSADGVAPDGMQRLHPLSVLFTVGAAARRLLLPGLFVVLFRPGGQYDVWLMVLFVPAVLAALAKYASYRFRTGGDELVVREGIVTRNERHIPYQRIQNIDLVQNVVHRLFGVAEVRIETASGERPEAVMRVLSLDTVEAMRRKVFEDRREPRADAESPVARPADPPLVRLGFRDLALFGLTSHRGLALVAAAMGVVWQFDPLERVDPKWLEERIGALELPEQWIDPAPLQTALLVTVTILVALLLLMGLSIVWATLRYYGFTLRARGDDMRAEYGLLTRINVTIPRQRIQQLTMRRGPIHRLVGRASMEAETAGHTQDEDGSGVEKLWLAPMIAEDRVDELIRHAMPDVDPSEIEWRPIAKRAWRRIVKKGLLAVLLVSLIAVFVLGPWAAAVLLAGALLAALHARLYVRHAGYGLVSNAVVYRSGWWVRKTSIVRYAKIQAVAFETNPFDRRNRMATVKVDTAGAGKMGHRVDMRFLDAPIAGEVMERLVAESGSRSFRW